MSLNIGQRIADPRSLSDELADDHNNHNTMYSGLATYTFGSPRSSSRSSSLASLDAFAEPSESISPLTAVPRRSSFDRTPRPSVFVQPAASPPFHNVSSHPSQGVQLSASSLHPAPSQSRRHPATRVPPLLVPVPPSVPRSRAVSGSDSEKSLDHTAHSDHIIPTYFSSQRGSVMPDNASQHTFGRASRTHAVTAALSHDGPIPSSSSASVTTSRSSSRASMRTSTEQFSSEDELEIDDYDGNSSPVTFAREYLNDYDEDFDFNHPGPSTSRASIFDGRRGSLPMAIPGAVQGSDVYSNRSREGSILTIRRPSRSLDDSSTHRSSLGGEDPTVHPKSEPSSRAGRISLEQLQASQQQVVETNAWDGLDLQYILSRQSEGSIRSFNSHLSFVQSIAAAARSSSQHISTIAPFAGGSTTGFGDTFTTHIQNNDSSFNTIRYWWSFQREKADASSSMRRRQQAQHRADKLSKETPSRTQEMWRCGLVGRFKVDRLVFKPQSADPTKGAQQRIHVRHIPDPFLMGNTITGPHSVIHKHSRAVAFSIFRSYSLFSSRQAGALSAAPTHMNMRSGTMLALKKVQEQYTSTRTTRQLGPFQTGDKKSAEDKERGGRRGTRSLSSRDRERKQDKDKESKGKGKSRASSKSRGKEKKHRMNQTESTESSTATSSAGSVNISPTSAVRQTVSPADQPEMRIQLSPSTSSTSVYPEDTPSRRVSSMSSLSPSTADSTRVPETDVSLVPPIRRYREHRDSIDSDDRWPARTGTTHAEAFSKLDPNAIETLRSKGSSRTHTESGSTLAGRLIRVFLPRSSKSDDHSLVAAQPIAFSPPWMSTAGRDQQEENDRVLDDLNASFRDVGLLHTSHHKPSKNGPKQKPSQSILDQIRDDCLYMLLPLWPGESDAISTQAETSSTASVVPVPENRQFLLVYYVPFSESSSSSGNKKPEKKKPNKHSHSSESGTELDPKTVYLPAFRVVARVVTYDKLQSSGVRIPSEGLAVNGPEWEAMHHSAVVQDDEKMPEIVVCQCLGRERGFDFLQDGLLKLGLCTREEFPVQEDMLESEEGEREVGRIVLTPIGRAAVEMIWLGCLAITSFGPS
ncbi:hypothetical protein JVU11DRAFT_2822 [Chiua virens]|nr:hypothetical protein JVU11DRAFT_2822 [Chiua virens]